MKAIIEKIAARLDMKLFAQVIAVSIIIFILYSEFEVLR